MIALGVQNQADLDKALKAHGRILHSAFVTSIEVGSAQNSRDDRDIACYFICCACF